MIKNFNEYFNEGVEKLLHNFMMLLYFDSKTTKTDKGFLVSNPYKLSILVSDRTIKITNDKNVIIYVGNEYKKAAHIVNTYNPIDVV